MTKDEKDFGFDRTTLGREEKSFSLEPPFTMIICGNTGSGKTQLLKHMITNELSKKFDYIFIMCPSLEFSGDYKEFENHKKIKDNNYQIRLLGNLVLDFIHHLLLVILSK